MPEKPLYEDLNFKVEYNERSPQDHMLFIKEGDSWMPYAVDRGILQELARTQVGGIEAKLSAMNDMILAHLREKKLGVDGLHIAFCQAYQKEQDRYFKDALSEATNNVDH